MDSSQIPSASNSCTPAEASQDSRSSVKSFKLITKNCLQTKLIEQPEVYQFKPAKKLLKTDKKRVLIADKLSNGNARMHKSPKQCPKRKPSIFGKNTDDQLKRCRSPFLPRNRSQQNMCAGMVDRTEEFHSKTNGFYDTSVENSNQITTYKHMPSNKQKPRSPFLRTCPSQQSHKYSGRLSTAKNLNLRIPTVGEEYQINRLKIENEFMRTLYHKLCTAKDNEKIRHAEAEAKLRRERQCLEMEVQMLRCQLNSIKSQKKVRIDHVFTHKMYDKTKNKIDRDHCIKEAASYLEESHVNCPQQQRHFPNSQMEYYKGKQLSMPEVSERLRNRSIQNRLYSHNKCTDDSVQPSTESASESFCSLGIESAGESNVKE